jgi:ferric-dicitrate binding protein FerR (iron transport regulator)
MIPETSCARVEPWLHAFEEGELSPEERELLLVHVASCTRCAAELCSEQALTSLLGPPPAPPASPRRRNLRVLAAVALVGLAFALVPLLVPARPAYGQASLASTPTATPLPQPGRGARAATRGRSRRATTSPCSPDRASTRS